MSLGLIDSVFPIMLCCCFCCDVQSVQVLEALRFYASSFQGLKGKRDLDMLAAFVVVCLTLGEVIAVVLEHPHSLASSTFLFSLFLSPCPNSDHKHHPSPTP